MSGERLTANHPISIRMKEAMVALCDKHGPDIESWQSYQPKQFYSAFENDLKSCFGEENWTTKGRVKYNALKKEEFVARGKRFSTSFNRIILFMRLFLILVLFSIVAMFKVGPLTDPWILPRLNRTQSRVCTALQVLTRQYFLVARTLQLPQVSPVKKRRSSRLRRITKEKEGKAKGGCHRLCQF